MAPTVRLLGHRIPISPLLASILAGSIILVMWNELELFGRIKEAYRQKLHKYPGYEGLPFDTAQGRLFGMRHVVEYQEEASQAGCARARR